MASPDRNNLVTLHLRAGWWAILVFLSAGLVLETLHGFKAPFYLDVGNESRRLMWTLGHSHGTLFGLLNIGAEGSRYPQERRSVCRNAPSGDDHGRSIRLGGPRDQSAG